MDRDTFSNLVHLLYSVFFVIIYTLAGYNCVV